MASRLLLERVGWKESADMQEVTENVSRVSESMIQVFLEPGSTPAWSERAAT